MNMDERIDAAAQAMTDAHPSADFRARVLAALPARQPRPSPRVAIPVAAAVLAGTIAWLAGANAHRTLEPAFAEATAGRPVVPAFAEATAGKPVVPVVPDVPVVPVVPLEDPAWRARAIPRLVSADALVMDRIQPNPLSIAPITVEPIAPPDPIALAAIDSRAGGR
jgi:hypothetical protein